MPVKTSVIVAVYNPGADIEELLDSLDRQSLSPDEFEVIFADDDSTDGSRERLQEWALTRPHVRVLHNTPNSGWPGKPRNMAIDVARGEYLFFADNDDVFASRGLEWMYDFAAQHESDVVIANEAGVGQPVNRKMFQRNVIDAKLGQDPILGTLTPHKLVRTSMVRDHGIRFPEGKVRLEDHFFIVSCYFAARRISILADKPCYFWMARPSVASNASFRRPDPAEYWGAVGRAMEVVEANTEPGPLRDQAFAHWYLTKMMRFLYGRRLLKLQADYQEAVIDELRRLSERFGLGEAQWPWMGASARQRSRFLLHGSNDDLREVARVERAVTSKVELESVDWTAEGDLRLRLKGHFVYEDDQTPVHIDWVNERAYWNMAPKDCAIELPPVDVTDLVDQVDLNVLVKDRDSSALRFAEGTSTPQPVGDVLGAQTEAIVDIEDIIAVTGNGPWDLSSFLEGVGFRSERRIALGDVRLPEPRVVGDQKLVVYATEGYGNLSVRSVKAPASAKSAPEAASPGADQPAPSAPNRGRAFAARALRRAARMVDRT